MNKLTIGILGLLLLFSCSENQEKTTQKEEQLIAWKFVKEIPLQNITPIGIVAQNNFLWLSDVDNNRVVKIDLNGKIIEEFNDFERPMHIAIQENKIYIPQYTSDTISVLEKGSISNLILNETVDGISGLAIDGDRMAIADFYNHRVILKKGQESISIGKEGHNDGELYYPTDVDIYDNKIYVADAYNNRVQVFDVEGNYVQMIGWNEDIHVATGIKVTANEVIVADFEGNRVLIYDINGKLLQTLSENFNHPTDIEVYDNKIYVTNYKGKSISVFEK